MVVRNIIRFIVLVLFQVLVLNNIRFGGYLNPFLYVYFILLLPFETPRWLLLISSFLLGLSVDLFTHTPGMHAAASVLMAFSRPFVAKGISSKKEYEPGMVPGIRDLGFNWFFFYSLILILIHHTALYFIEVFRLDEFMITMERALVNSIFTLVTVILTQYLLYSRK